MAAAGSIVKNMGVLYIRGLVSIGISIVVTRLILNSLGEINFGIFNLIAGVVAMLAFFNAAMTTSTQRFFSYFHGNGNQDTSRKIFWTSTYIHVGLGLGLLGLLEICRLFLIPGVLNIPPERIASSQVLYQFVTFNVFLTVLSVPFTAFLVSYENMTRVAVVNIAEDVLKLFFAVILAYVPFDPLIFYGATLTLVTFIGLAANVYYCFRNYPECSRESWRYFDSARARELWSFAAWNLFGAACGLVRVQGIAVIMNIFLGAMVNAAYGISNQLSSAMSFFSANMQRSLNPQLMKSEGAGNRARMLELSMLSCKYGFLLLAFFALPTIFEMNSILNLWLDDNPDNTTIFSQLFLVSALINQITVGFQAGIQARGRIKVYQFVVGSLLLLNVPVAFVLLHFKFAAYQVLVSMVFLDVLAGIARTIILRHYAGLSIKQFLQQVCLKIIPPTLFSIGACLLVTSTIDDPFRFILTCVISSISFCISGYFLSLSFDERQYIKNLIGTVFRKIQLHQ